MRHGHTDLFVCCNVTGRRVTSSNVVLRRYINAVEEFATAEVKLSCPLATTTGHFVVANDLAVADLAFLLQNDLAWGRV